MKMSVCLSVRQLVSQLVDQCRGAKNISVSVNLISGVENFLRKCMIFDDFRIHLMHLECQALLDSK